MGKFVSKSIEPLSHCTLWKCDRSPACRSVLMALDAMNLNVIEVDIEIDKAEHRTPEMLKLNPLQTLPVFKDKELILYDSHAIITYLASRYGTHDLLLPKEPNERALVDQLLFYNCGVIYPRFRGAADPILYHNCRSVLPPQVCHIETTYDDLETILRRKQWLSGHWMTLGDIAIAANISTLNILVPIDKKRFPFLVKWLNKLSDSLFYTTANGKGLSEFAKRIDNGVVSNPEEFKNCTRSSYIRRTAINKIDEK